MVRTRKPLARWNIYLFIGSRQAGSRSAGPSFRPLVFCFVFFFSRPTDLYHSDLGESYTHARARPFFIDANDDVRLPAFDPLPHLILGFFNFICKNIFLHTSERWSLDCREESCDTSEGSVCFVLRTFFRFIFYFFIFFFRFSIFYLPKYDCAELPLCRCSSSLHTLASRLEAFQIPAYVSLGCFQTNCPFPTFFLLGCDQKGLKWKKKKILSFDLLRSLCLCLCLFCSYMTTLNVAQRIETEVTSFEPPVVYFQYVLKVTHKHCTITAEHVHSNL